jgi:hypothetical protein
MSNESKSVVAESKVSRTAIMNPEHSKWEEFANMMKNPQWHIGVETDSEGRAICKHSFSITQKVLLTFPDVDVEATLEYFRRFNCQCDCQLAEMIISDVDGDPMYTLGAYKCYADLRTAINNIFEFFGANGIPVRNIQRATLNAAKRHTKEQCKKAEVFNPKRKNQLMRRS